MNPRVQHVQCKDKSHLIVTFNNGEVKLFDTSPYFEYPVFEPLKDLSFFRRAHVVQGTVAWDDDVDFDPDTLYLDGITIT
jgi:hypothetical protein